jgi:hypothetical protein
MKKELRPDHPLVDCDVCGRTLLKGEHAEPYLAPGGQRKLVCDLCAGRAAHEGWIRESGHADLPAGRRRPEGRRSLLGRLRGRGGPRPHEPAALEHGVPAAPDELDPRVGEASPERAEDGHPETQHSRPKDPRHVRAVPTNAEIKVERALELFNESEHTRTIAGLARTLGEPWVSANPVLEAPSEVIVVIAWELSWYRFRVDLGDADEPVSLADKGEELDELDPELRAWNGRATTDGRLEVGVGSKR